MKNERRTMKAMPNLWKGFIGFAVLGLAQAGFPASEPAPAPPALTADGFAVPQPNHSFQFPRDHGSHPAFKIEWWYVTGHLRAEGGREFGYQATFFRRSVRPYSQPAPEKDSNFGRDEIHLAHMALTDMDGKAYHSEERLNRNGWDASAKVGDLDMHNGNWSLRRTGNQPADETMRLRSSIRADAAWDLKMIPAKPKVIFGEDRLSRKGADPTACSWYITFTRLTTEGMLRLNGERLRVTGESWMDHEISSSQLGEDQVGWDWACLQLDDGREIMVYLMRRQDGTFDSHSTLVWIDREGGLRHLKRDEFQWQPETWWSSPKTRARYPARIRLTVSDPEFGKEATFTLVPRIPDQELIGHLGGIDYWEGACTITDDNGKAVGRAYMELTGYSDPITEKLR